MQEPTALQQQDEIPAATAEQTSKASTDTGRGIAKLKSLWANFRRPTQDTRPKLTLGQKFKQLSYSQWLYFAAFVYLIQSGDGADWTDNEILVVGLIAGIGLARELWQLFYKMWNTMLGKGVLLVLYAATANFALAIAALKVNAIAGVEPTPLRFTLGFTTLIMLPMWIFLASFLLSAVLLTFGNLWSLIALLLRIIRIRLPIHWEDRSFAGLSMFLRLCLLPFVIAAVYSLIEPYLKQVYVFDAPIQVVKTDIDPEVYKELANLPEEQQQAKIKELQEAGLIEVSVFGQEVDVTDISSEEFAKQETATEESASEQDASEEGTPEETAAEESESEEPRSLTIDRMIAGFIYQLETYPYSSCMKEPQQRVLTLDEYSMLVAERDADSPLGFSFSIQQCVPYYPTTGKTYQDPG